MITGVLLSVTLLAISAQHADTLPGDLRDGRAALEAGDVARAIQLAERYSRSHDRDPRGYLLLGDAYAERMPSGRSTIEFEVSD
jgi:predicted Zn-dependent protease